MKKIFKKALSVFMTALSLSLMMGIPFSEIDLGITASAADTISEAEAVNLPTTLVVDGVSVISSGTVGTTTVGTGWSYDSSTSTLTLSNANITNGDNGYGAGIYYDGGDLTINLFGENTIGYSGHGMSIFFKADTNERTLTITGDGSLMLTGSLYNEYSTGEGKINIVGTTLTTSDISGLGDVTIIDSTVIADGAGWAGIYSEANVIITNSYVEAKSSDGGGIQVSDHLKIIDSQVEIGGSKGDIVNYSSRTYTDSVVTTSTETTVYGEAALKEELTIASGETISFEEGASITNTDKLTVEDDAIVSENGALHTHNTDGAVTYTYVDDSCHEKVTACLNCPIGYAAETSEVHTGGTAACAAKSICSICKNEYGELDFNNHTSDQYTNGFRNCCGEYQPATLTTDKYDIDGDSIKDNVYEIGNAGQLYWFAGLVNGTLDGVAQDKYANAVLTKDIIVNSGTFSIDSNNNPLYNGCEISETNKPFEWVPIGIYYDSDGNGTVDSDEYAFYYGTFDGNNHSVSGLYLNDSSQNFVGLFGRSADTVKNVGVINSYFNGNEYVGGVCGSGFEIINCCNKSIVSGTQSVGGVCGFLNSTHRSIVNCYNTGVVLGTEKIGGVCGYGYCVIVNCYNTGDVTGSSNIGEIYGYGGGAYANNYYLADSDDGKGGKIAEQFASGEAAYLLSQGGTIEADDMNFYEDQTFSGEIWGQTLSGDSMEAYPVLNGKKVYYGYLSCAENAARVYTNDSNASDTKPEHTPNADDGNCTTAITCSVCGTVTTEAKATHTPNEDDGDCTTAITCSVCGTVTTEAKATHTPNADDGDCTTAVTCSVCGTVTTEAKATHTPNEDDGDCTTAVTCSVCGTVTTEAKASHTPNADDGNCTTPVTCSVCGKVTTEAKPHTDEDSDNKCDECGSDIVVCTEHIPNEDDGDCTTAITCSVCGEVTTAAKSHTDGNSDDRCDNCGTELGTASDIGTFSGWSVSLDEKIGVNFYMILTDAVKQDAGAYVLFTWGGNESSQVYVSEAGYIEKNNEIWHKFSCDVVAAQMKDEITAKLITSDMGESSEYTYSVSEYIESKHSDAESSDKLVELLEAMANYGAYAQLYFNYNPNDLANDGMGSELGDVTLSGYDKVINGTLQNGVSYLGSSLLLESEVVIRHYFSITDGAIVAELNDSLGNSNWSELASVGNGRYYTEQIVVATELDDAKTLTLGSWSIQYSAMSYAQSMLNGGTTNEKLKNLLKALFYYSEAADAYFGQ